MPWLGLPADCCATGVSRASQTCHWSLRPRGEALTGPGASATVCRPVRLPGEVRAPRGRGLVSQSSGLHHSDSIGQGHIPLKRSPLRVETSFMHGGSQRSHVCSTHICFLRAGEQTWPGLSAPVGTGPGTKALALHGLTESRGNHSVALPVSLQLRVTQPGHLPTPRRRRGRGLSPASAIAFKQGPPSSSFLGPSSNQILSFVLHETHRWLKPIMMPSFQKIDPGEQLSGAQRCCV